MKYLRIIDDYLCDKLSSDEILKIETELIVNDEFRAEFEQVALLLDMIDEVGQGFNWDTGSVIDFEVNMDVLAAYYGVNNVTGEIYPHNFNWHTMPSQIKENGKEPLHLKILRKKLKGCCCCF